MVTVTVTVTVTVEVTVTVTVEVTVTVTARNGMVTGRSRVGHGSVTGEKRYVTGR